MTEFPLIPTYREVEIAGGDLRFDELASSIAGTAAEGWTHDAELEKSRLLSEYRWCVMRREDSPGRPGLEAFLTTSPGRAYVSNIVATHKHELSYGEYNAAALEYARLFAEPAAQALGLSVTVTDEVIDIRAEFSEEITSTLLAFSRGANRSTGFEHPTDRARWFDFITSVHRSGKDLSPSDLGMWLEMDGWNERTASDLVIEFEFGLGLLRHVDRH